MSDLFQRKLLIIENEDRAGTPLREHFASCGMVCLVAKDLSEGRKLLAEDSFDAIILDPVLPDGDGLALFEEESELPPVIVYSEQDDEREMLRAFSLGATDYVVRPCSPLLMEARLSLRLLPRKREVVSCGKLEMNLNSRTVSYDGMAIKLTSSEFRILYFLITHPNKFYSADALYKNVWNALSMQTSVVRFHITNLRKTLLTATGKRIILTEFGTGYALSSEECQ